MKVVQVVMVVMEMVVFEVAEESEIETFSLLQVFPSYQLPDCIDSWENALKKGIEKQLSG